MSRQFSLVMLISLGLLFFEKPVFSGEPIKPNHLSIAQAASDSATEAYYLFKEGQRQLSNAQYQSAIETFQKTLEIYRKIGDQESEASVLNNLGLTYSRQSQYQEAVKLDQQAVEILSRIKQPTDYGKGLLGSILNNLGSAYYSLGDLSASLNAYQQALINHQKIGNLELAGDTLSNIALTYSKLGQYSEALELYQRALASAKHTNNLMVQGRTLNNMGVLYYVQKQYLQALNSFQAALKLRQQTRDYGGESYTLNGLGRVYTQLRRYPQAEVAFQQSLKLAQQVNSRRSEGRTLDSFGDLYVQLNQYPKALRAYQQALEISRDIGDRDAERTTLSNLGSLFAKQGQPDLAIVFYKQSVNVIESIRKNIQQLSKDKQESYVHTVSDTYRRLADLLLAQGRLSEAQRVLELLKLQELKDFTRSSPVEDKQEVTLLQPEKQILDQYGSLVAFGQKLYDCEHKGQPCKDLRDQLDQLTVAFNRESNTFSKTLRERLAKDPAFLTSDQLGSTATDVVTAQAGTVLIYPLVLDNRLRLLLAVKAGEQGIAFRTVEVSNVGQQKLWKTVSRFRELLQDSTTDLSELQQVSAQLYDWIIRPLEKELNPKQIRHLVFALDRATRYIPMAALFDNQSQQYLIQKYAVSNILAAELTDTRDRLPTKPDQISVLALGVSKSVPGFSALPNVPKELGAIVQNSSNSQGMYHGSEFLDEAFDYTAFRDNLRGRQIVHIATHGKFEPGQPENSFILPGKGNRLTIAEIQKLQNYMGGVHLIVLSACQTAVGGPDESGIEIPGISFYFLKNRVKAVIASLWLVNDSSTSVLMQQFYQNLGKGTMSKAEALQQAQIAVMQSSSQSSQLDRGNFRIETTQAGKPAVIPRNLSHPFYWAPFILIGNSL